MRGHLKVKHAGHPREGELLPLQGEQRALQRGHVTAQAGGQLADGMVGVPAALAERRHAILALEAAVDEVLPVDGASDAREGVAQPAQVGGGVSVLLVLVRMKAPSVGPCAALSLKA